jgi:site-specific DNA-methyltransferase (adenine-specific)
LHVVTTSPPYNLGKRYNRHNDGMKEVEYLAWQDEVAHQIARLLVPESHLFLNVGWNSQFPWRSMQVAEVYGRHLTLQQHIHLGEEHRIGRLEPPVAVT